MTEEQMLWCSRHRVSVIHGPCIVLGNQHAIQLLEGEVLVNLNLRQVSTSMMTMSLRTRCRSREDMLWDGNW